MGVGFVFYICAAALGWYSLDIESYYHTTKSFGIWDFPSKYVGLFVSSMIFCFFSIIFSFFRVYFVYKINQSPTAYLLKLTSSRCTFFKWSSVLCSLLTWIFGLSVMSLYMEDFSSSLQYSGVRLELAAWACALLSFIIHVLTASIPKNDKSSQAEIPLSSHQPLVSVQY
jgi:hypothetical protein